MRTTESIVAELRERGELLEVAPGIVSLRGPALSLLRYLDRELGALCRLDVPDEWSAPPAIALATLERADYFASFPFWLTAAAHLPDDEDILERIATSATPIQASRAEFTATHVALPPALCYHVYQHFSGRQLTTTRLVTLAGTCWRHEGARLVTLDRQWAFTMREVVCLGSADAVEAFRQRAMHAATALAARLGIDAAIVEANDPFFAPTARGKLVLQRLKALKHELALPLGDTRTTAAASFNHHEHFFGERFDIRLDSDTPASTGCIAFGLERWLLAFLVAHGVDRAHWPARARMREEAAA